VTSQVSEHDKVWNPVATAACLGDSDAFDRSVTDFSQRYADQNERDYREFVRAMRSGRLEAREGV
jgi:transcription initiation factor TFIID subunit TAF12